MSDRVTDIVLESLANAIAFFGHSIRLFTLPLPFDFAIEILALQL